MSQRPPVISQGNYRLRVLVVFALMLGLLAIVGFAQSWSLALTILNLCIISAVMALGVNIQWGYAGLFNVGIMGFAALGGLAVLLIAMPPVKDAWAAGGIRVIFALIAFAITIALALNVHKHLKGKRFQRLSLAAVLIIGIVISRFILDPGVSAIEAVNPASTGYLGGLGLPVVLAWLVGGAFAAGVAWLIGKVALGLRADYLAIATLGISEIIVAFLRNEDWLTRGVKNVTGLPRPVPYELELQQTPWFIELVEKWNASTLTLLGEAERVAALKALLIEGSSIFVKLSYACLFLVVLLIIYQLAELALNSPWGRMVRAIRDNEVAADAMGKDVTGRHLQIFILGSAVVGIAGAMLVTLDGQFTPGSYNPLRYTFLIWVMVIVGGSGNNLGAIIGGFLVWFIWVEAEPIGFWLINSLTSGMGEDSGLRKHLLDSAQYMRVIIMGSVLLLVMRFSPWGILPEQTKQFK
ncbi:MAG: branched-chain amino acid ABC transporter permease [Thiofilum sp.]|uniref:ABC transporter permease subunit n=1 Tax=Thiofilum sp. TaxID=2212733 RepID=UPI0025D37028|nr:branched-chain amino acid ABC transporter permease [Thiofilum sp.]MBK8455482.1 branched-chain amino acid ABC transporter permease [Thiofilum sp.]